MGTETASFFLSCRYGWAFGKGLGVLYSGCSVCLQRTSEKNKKISNKVTDGVTLDVTFGVNSFAAIVDKHALTYRSERLAETQTRKLLFLLAYVESRTTIVYCECILLHPPRISQTGIGYLEHIRVKSKK